MARENRSEVFDPSEVSIVHRILRNRPNMVKTWSGEEVAARRILFLFPKCNDQDRVACEPQ